MRSGSPSRENAALQHEIVRLGGLTSFGVAAIYGLVGLFGNNPELLSRAVGPAIMGGLALALLKGGHARADLFLSAAAVFVVVQVSTFPAPDVKNAASMGLVMIGVAASLFVPGDRRTFLIGYSVLLTASHLWWFRSAGTTFGDVGRIVVPALMFLFIARLLSWARATGEVREARYAHLFSQVPVSIWEEDFTGVERKLTEFRRAGVTDLRRHLADHPEDLAASAAEIVVRDVNPATLDLLGVDSKEDLLGPLQPASFTEHTMSSFEEQLVAIWEGRETIDIEVRGRTFTGEPIDGRLRWVVPRHGEGFDLSHVVVAMLDTTELNRTERRLQELVASKDQFIASVSHELRTPLTAVVGLAEELRQSQHLFSEAERREFIDTIATQAREVAHIVEDLLVAARAEGGTVSVLRERVDLKAVVQRVAASMNGTTPVINLPGEPLLALADASRVRQILRNLLTNALRYGGDHVEIRSGWKGDTVWVEVSDDGCGIAEDDRERIFEPYQSAHRVAGVTASVGLGLTVSRQLARLMDGELEYLHEPGRSSFRLSLPRLESSG